MMKEDKAFLKSILFSILGTVLVGLILWNGASYNKKDGFTKLSYEENEVFDVREETDIPTVVSDSISGVVGISVLKVDDKVLFGDNTKTWGIGSGVVVSDDGYILTNKHVATDNSKKMIVTFSDGTEKEGTRVWSNDILDLAIIKVDANNLKFLKLGDSNLLKVGETAIAIGNPLGFQFQRTVTAGIVSALNRTIRLDEQNYMEDLIQTDASINPGNSGGPLLNRKGEVIGINTVKIESAEGIGFAIPINVAAPVINHLIQDGTFDEPYLGVFAYDREIIPYMTNNLKLEEGIIVVDLDKEGPAYKSGLKEGIIIISLDDIKVNTMLGLRSYLYTKKPNDIVNVTYRENGEIKSVNVKLDKKVSLS